MAPLKLHMYLTEKHEHTFFIKSVICLSISSWGFKTSALIGNTYNWEYLTSVNITRFMITFMLFYWGITLSCLLTLSLMKLRTFSRIISSWLGSSTLPMCLNKAVKEAAHSRRRDISWQRIIENFHKSGTQQ